MSLELNRKSGRKDYALALAFVILCVVLYFLPTGFEERVDETAERCPAEVLAVDNSSLQKMGMITSGFQDVRLKMLEGPYAGQVMDGTNQMRGRLDLDKIFVPGDRALAVVTKNPDGSVAHVNPQDHYRLDWELMLLGLFALLLVAFGGITGAKALLSFLFAAMMTWKVLAPMFLEGYDPIWVSLAVVASLTGAIIFLVGGLNKKGLVAFLGALMGVGTSCGLACYFTQAFHLHGAVLPFAETLLYSGYGHLDLTRIFMAAVFLAASGAVMDLAMDVAASLDEVVARNPGISPWEAARSGIRVGRAVVGTMTTTLLLAYSGGYVTLLMAFMAQGVPLANLFNMLYVAAEVLKTLVGSFGLVTVAPFTAVIGALIYTRHRRRASLEPPQETVVRLSQPEPVRKRRAS